MVTRPPKSFAPFVQLNHQLLIENDDASYISRFFFHENLLFLEANLLNFLRVHQSGPVTNNVESYSYQTVTYTFSEKRNKRVSRKKEKKNILLMFLVSEGENDVQE